MATIKDIASVAGVAQGTVSNVLNRRGNVSSEKIRLVMDACEKLGYVPNERAKILRKGHARLLGVLLPDLHAQRYTDFYQSFKTYAENHGYTVRHYLPRQGSREAETAALLEARSDMVAGLALFSGFLHEKDYLPEEVASPMRLLYVERCPDRPANTLSFQDAEAGAALGQRVAAMHLRRVCLLTERLVFSHAAAFERAFADMLDKAGCQLQVVQTDSRRKAQNILQGLENDFPDAIVCTTLEFATEVRHILSSFYDRPAPPILTLSPLQTMPEASAIKYELNYRLLGHAAARRLIHQIEQPGEDRHQTLANTGFRQWAPPALLLKDQTVRPLNLLTLDSPTAYAMKHMSKLYTRQTGVPVQITICAYDEIYEAFNHLREASIYDVLRLDVTWLSWFAEKILRPLDDIDPTVLDDLQHFLPGTPERYAYSNGRLFALPSTPSTQMLFYRSDLFSDPINRRLFQETYRHKLNVPTTFDEFNRIAAFFTRSLRADSPVAYGATMTLGSTGVAGSEFLARLFSVQDDLCDADGSISLNTPAAVRALEQLVEVQHYCAPEKCAWWTNTAADFAQGDVAMAILYNNFAAPLLGHRSHVLDRIGYAMIPGGKPIIGGGSLGVSRYSRQPERALHYIRWMCSEPVASAATLMGSVSPCKASYDNYEIINNHPWLRLAGSCFAVAKGRRTPPGSVRPFNERGFMSILGMAVKNACSGAQSPQDALNYAQSLLDDQFFAR